MLEMLYRKSRFETLGYGLSNNRNDDL